MDDNDPLLLRIQYNAADDLVMQGTAPMSLTQFSQNILAIASGFRSQRASNSC